MKGYVLLPEELKPHNNINRDENISELEKTDTKIGIQNKYKQNSEVQI